MSLLYDYEEIECFFLIYILSNTSNHSENGESIWQLFPITSAGYPTVIVLKFVNGKQNALLFRYIYGNGDGSSYRF